MKKKRQQGDDEKKTGMKERERKRKTVPSPFPREWKKSTWPKSRRVSGKKERTSIGGKKIFQAGDFTIWGPVAYGGPTHVLSMAGLATSPSSTTSISLTTFSTLQPLTKVSH